MASSLGKTNAEVRALSTAQQEMLDRIALPLALMGGTYAMRDAGQTYLPQEPAETSAAYTIRLNGSTLFNAYARTVGTLVGKPFSQPVKFDEDLPPEFQVWADNIDLTGRTLTEFLAALFEDAINCALSHILVEMPDVPPMNAAAERQAGIRPYWVHLKEQNILGWRSEIIGGKQRLTQLRILEHATEFTGKWGETETEQVRVLYAGSPNGAEAAAHWEIWRPVQSTANSEVEWMLFDSGIYTTLTEIPVVSVYTSRTAFMQGKPPLTDLADVNVAHWRSYSDQRHILHVVRVPILFATGLGEAEGEEGQQFTVSPNSLTRGDAGATLQYVEHSGAAIGAGRDDLQDLEDRMAALGAEAITQMRFGPKGTATEAAEISAESDASLGGWIQILQKGAQEAWDLSHRYFGRDPVGKLSISTDWGAATKDPNAGTTILAFRAAGLLSQETALIEAQAQGVFTTDFDPADELEKAATEVPPAQPTSPPPAFNPEAEAARADTAAKLLEAKTKAGQEQ